MNRKPIFDAVRTLVGGSLTQTQVDLLDAACDLAEAAVSKPALSGDKPAKSDTSIPKKSVHKLGNLSQRFESGKEGPATVSGGHGDPGGVSYGTYQFSSREKTLTPFLAGEGKPWAAQFVGTTPGSTAFSDIWRKIAKAEPLAFGEAQHAFTARHYYRSTVDKVMATKGLNIDVRHDAIRDATWSVAVQHGKALQVLVDAIDACDMTKDRSDAGYDRALIDAIYDKRTAYVLGVATNKNLSEAEKKQLISITKNRYVEERRLAIAMFGAAAPIATAPIVAKPMQVATNADGSVNGNIVAAQNGVAVKNAGVKISRLHAKMAPVIVAVAEAVTELGLPQAVITSGNDSKHGTNSLHAKWRALDFRGNNIKATVGHMLANAVRQRLGSDYDVIFETFDFAPNNHLHVEYDPN